MRHEVILWLYLTVVQGPTLTPTFKKGAEQLRQYRNSEIARSLEKITFKEGNGVSECAKQKAKEKDIVSILTHKKRLQRGRK